MVATERAGEQHRHVDHAGDAQAQDQRVVGEHAGDVAGAVADEDLAAVQHLLAPRRVLLLLAAADRIGGRIAGVHALDLPGRQEGAGDGEQPMVE